MYLLDTNVVSELRKRRDDPGAKQWVADQSAADLAISVVTVIEIEIETGILRKGRTDPDQAQILMRWFEQKVLTGFADRSLPVDPVDPRCTDWHRGSAARCVGRSSGPWAAS